MATAKLNKEVLLKHKFWIVLLVFLLLWIATMCILQATASVPVGEKKTAYEAAVQAVKGAKDKGPKNESFYEPWRKYAQAYAGQKATVWKEAWELQKDMISWPPSATAPFRERWESSPTLVDFLKGLNDVDKRWNSVLARNEFKESLYIQQFQDLDKEVKPAVLNGGIEQVFQPVAWTGDDKPPLIEEIWLAQEDFWVRKELLGIVSSVLGALAHFDHVPEDKKPQPAGAPIRHRFKNSTWEVDLVIEQSKQGKQRVISPRSQIKNKHVNKRMLKLANPRTNKGLTFQLRQGTSKFKFQIEGEPLAYDQSAPFQKEIRADVIDLRRPFELDQVFDWDNAPVRRIDALQTAWHSHRTVTKALEPNKALAGVDPPEPVRGGAPGGGTSAPSSPASPPGGPPAAPPPGGPGPGTTPGGRAGGMETTPSGIIRQRYISTTEQCRHMPIGLLLVVDQAHIHDVLIAVANSRLRIQITQVAFNHIHGVAPPPDEPTPEELRDGRPRPVAAVAPRPNVPNRFAAPSGPARPPAGVRLNPGVATTTTTEGEDPDLVELAVYGIATLYERFPENRTPATGTPGTPGAPGTNPAGTPSPAPTSNPAGSAPAGPPKSPPTASPVPMPPTGQAPAAPRPDENGKVPPVKAPDGKGAAAKGAATKTETPKADEKKGGPKAP